MASNLDMVNTMQTFGGHMQIRYASYCMNHTVCKFLSAKNDHFGSRVILRQFMVDFDITIYSLEFNFSEILFKNCQNV